VPRLQAAGRLLTGVIAVWCRDALTDRMVNGTWAPPRPGEELTLPQLAAARIGAIVLAEAWALSTADSPGAG
jgi:hypothetical protein